MWSALTQTCEIARLEIDQLLSLSDVPISLWLTTWSNDLNSEDNFKEIYDQMSVSFLLEEFFFNLFYCKVFNAEFAFGNSIFKGKNILLSKFRFAFIRAHLWN